MSFENIQQSIILLVASMFAVTNRNLRFSTRSQWQAQKFPKQTVHKPFLMKVKSNTLNDNNITSGFDNVGKEWGCSLLSEAVG